MINLRGHHLLCLLGFRGMGYSEEYTEKMKNLHRTLRREPDTLISITSGPDDLCRNFPSDKPYHCDERVVHERDDNILTYLGLKVGQMVLWREIENRIANVVVPDDIPRFCQTCPWRPYGVCEEGVQRVRDGKSLIEV